jgi:hypothetical protein
MPSSVAGSDLSHQIGKPDNEWKLAQMHARFPAVNSESFFVTRQDGYLRGIILPEWLNELANNGIRYLPMSIVAQSHFILECCSEIRYDPDGFQTYGFAAIELSRCNGPARKPRWRNHTREHSFAYTWPPGCGMGLLSKASCIILP